MIEIYMWSVTGLAITGMWFALFMLFGVKRDA